jgi:site-specific recombinase XerD
VQLIHAHALWIRSLRATRDLSPHTIRAYDGDLSSFEVHLGAGTAVDRVDQEALVGYLAQQRDSGLSPASLRRRASALRSFCRWLEKQGLLEADPWTATTIAFGRSRKLPRVLPAHELDRLLGFLRHAAGASPHQQPTSALVSKRPHEATTLLAVSLLVATGVRVHEVVGVRLLDVDLEGGIIRLLGKGRRERQVFLPNAWLTSLTRSYLTVRNGFALSHPHLLFNTHLDPLTPAAMRSRLGKAAEAAGLHTHVTPHMLRHTAATQLIEAGVDIRYIQRLLGHASLSTTEIYTHVSDRALKRVISEADVLGRLAQAR